MQELYQVPVALSFWSSSVWSAKSMHTHYVVLPPTRVSNVHLTFNLSSFYLNLHCFLISPFCCSFPVLSLISCVLIPRVICQSWQDKGGFSSDIPDQRCVTIFQVKWQLKTSKITRGRLVHDFMGAFNVYLWTKKSRLASWSNALAKDFFA